MCRLFSRGVIFTRARVSLALLSLRKNGGLLVVYVVVVAIVIAASLFLMADAESFLAVTSADIVPFSECCKFVSSLSEFLLDIS